ncbi:MAG: type II secretion system F family protein [Desulforhopalus sp.]|jgi:type IV pilus assembly protein PilC|nr:type II secretion system F family protein [Desulforhopalus sp.]
MALYHYKAITSKGKVRHGNLDAANVEDLEHRLRQMALDLITCRVRSPHKPLFGVRKIQRVDLINFCFHMEQLLQAGVPLLEGLADLRDSIEHPRFQDVIANLVSEIEGGKTLSAAMADHPQVFDVLFVNLVIAGEATGELAKVFAALTKTIKWQDELAATTKKLLLFPAFVGSVVLAVTFFLMIYLVPQLVTFITGMGGKLPLHTRALIATSNFCVNYWYLILLLPITLLFGIKFLAAASIRVRYRLDDWKLRIWLIGPILKKILLSRFANFFAMMYAAGIPVLHSLKIAEGIVGNLVIKEALQEVAEDIQDGASIAASFENSGLFPPLVVRMLRVGETTGALDDALLNVSYFYDRDVQDAIAKAQTMIEPIMTVILGAILGWVMLSVLGPIYDMISKISL